MEPDYELAELGVVRGAAWPIESLDRFGSQQLVELALSSGDRDYQIYLAEYAKTFEREREILWEITAADDRFAKALMLSNRLVADTAVCGFMRDNSSNVQTNCEGEQD